MLPGASPTLPPCFHIRPVILAVDVPVKIGIAVDVNVDIPAVPVASSPGIPPGRAQRDASGKGQCPCCHISVWIIRIGWIGWIGPCTIHHRRVVGWDVHHLRIGRLNPDHSGLLRCRLLDDRGWRRGWLDDHRLLFCGLQVALRLRLGAESLDGVHDVLLLRQKRVAQLQSHVELLAHRGQDLGKVHQRLHTWVPTLRLQGLGQGLTFQGLVGLGPTIRLHHLQGIRGRHQNLRHQRVRIERDGRDELLDFLWLKRGAIALGGEAQGPWPDHQHGEKPDQERCGDMLHWTSFPPAQQPRRLRTGLLIVQRSTAGITLRPYERRRPCRRYLRRRMVTWRAGPRAPLLSQRALKFPTRSSSSSGTPSGSRNGVAPSS
jgi:hypothetical protein